MFSNYSYLVSNFSPSTSHDIQEITSFSQQQVIHFLVSASIWSLQQTFLSSNICEKLPAIHSEELTVLKNCFFKYDNYLTGEILISDFPLLLQVEVISLFLIVSVSLLPVVIFC
jgi:hypothetical protein